MLQGHPALSLYERLPRLEQLMVRGRLFTAPLAAVEARAPGGRILDVGCGHGLVSAMLALGRPDRQVLGIDPDERKIRWAKAALAGLPNAQLRQGLVQALLPEHRGAFDAVVIADVLYLLPLAQWRHFLEALFALLAPGGVLLLKETEADGSWKEVKCLLQELVMVRLLRKTHDSGGLHLQPRAVTLQLLRAVGFSSIEVVDLAAGYSTPHVLFVATRP